MLERDNIIEVKSLKTVMGGKLVHRGVDLGVRRGETMIVVGASGSGKSVLFKSIVGLVAPSSGSIMVDGVDITRASLVRMSEIRRGFGVLFQSGALFDSLNVYDNVAFPLYGMGLSRVESERVVDEKLDLVGLGVGIKAYMPGELSMGVRKRVALARAIVMGPRIILYDEPTTGLDPLVAGIIDELILHLQRELRVTSLVVTHDLQSAFRVGDRLSFLYDGIIEVCSSVEDVKATDNVHLREFISVGS